MSIETTATNSESCGWRFTLNSHPFCKKLHQQSNNSSKEKTNQVVPTISKGLIAVRDGSLFVWDFNSKQLVHLNLLSLASSTTATNNNSNNIYDGRSNTTDSSVDEHSNQFQVLVPSSDVGFIVEQILFNKTGQYLAIWGQVGISIMQMLQQSGKNAMYGGGKHNLVVRTFPLVERLFVSHADIRLLQVAWHPGSYYDGHVVFLALDNILRICDINEPDKIFQEIYLVSSNVPPPLHFSLYSVAIGDAAVSFHFGAVTELPCKSRTISKKKTRLVWPIYILRGSGDVLLLYSDITSKTSKFSLLTGPLLVHPPAEDNYGTDACSILCLQTTPPVVVIATNEGKLHHCIVLNEKNGKSTIPDSANSDDSSSLLDLPEYSSALSSDLYNQCCLYVYESVELELSLQSQSLRSNIPIEDVFTCPIHLVKDVSCEERYHCYHSAGIHSVSLPWLIHYEEFCNNANEENIPNISQSEKCLVEHVLCTKPLTSSPQFPVLGLGTTTNHLLGKTIIVLTSDLEFLTVPLNERYKLPPISSCSTLNPSDTFGSPLKELSKEPFDHQLAKILQRTTSTPILKSGKGADISQEECYMLLIRSTKVFREQYIQKQDLAIEEIKRRMNILIAQKNYQVSELKEMAKSQSTLKDFSQALAEKYESSKEKQDSLLKRLSVLVRKIQSHLPILSDAERDMMKELKNMEMELESLRKELNKTKKKKEYQEHQLSLTKSAYPNIVLSSQNLVQIKDILKDQNEEINSLMKTVKDLNLETLN